MTDDEGKTGPEPESSDAAVPKAEPGRPGSAPETEEKGKPTDEHEGGADEGVDADALRNDQRTINRIHKFQAQYAFLGGEWTAPRSVGAIKVDVITKALEVFCPSDSFGQAEKVLTEHSMVVLFGDEGSGRYFAALALLSGWPEVDLSHSVVSFSPTTTVAELAGRDRLKPGRRYVVHDMRGDGRSSADQRFELGRLRQALVRTGARLVITGSPSSLFRGDFGPLAVTWSAPAAAAVFDRHFACSGLSFDAADVQRAREHAAGLDRPGDVAAFVAHLDEGLERAMRSQSDADHEVVRTWFDDKGKTAEAEVAIAAACFLDRVYERVYDRCYARLRQLIKEYDLERRSPLSAPQTFVRNPAGAEVLLTTMDSEEPFQEPVVAFRSPHMRRHAVAEVWRRCGDNLLQPLRQWIHELARDVSLDVRVQTAVGLALLAERRWADVMESFIDRWSNDVAVNRAAAATTLSMMSASDLLAPQALETAITWSENRGPRRAMTAALALAGPLSERYPDKAFEQLWYLSTRGSQIAVVARVSLSLMLSGAYDDHDRALALLRNVGAALRWSAERRTARELRGDMTTTLTVLVAPSLSSDTLMIADLFRARPEAAEPLGALFAEVLGSGPHHHRGVDVLRRLLSELTDVDGAQALAERLGASVFSRWTEDVQRVLIPQIERALAMDADEAELSRQVVRSFIRGIDLR